MPPSPHHDERRPSRPPRRAALPPAVLALLLVTATVAGGAAAEPAGGPPAACAAGDRPGASDEQPSNVSVSVWTAPDGTFGDLRNASDVHDAVADGWLTPVSAGPARDDVLVLRLNVSGDARAVLDDLAAADAPGERFVGVVGEPEIRGEGFDLALRGGMCGIPLDWERTADHGGLTVVVDRSAGSLYVVLDPARAAFWDTPGWHGPADVLVQPPGGGEPVEAGQVDFEWRELTIGGDDRAELPAVEAARLTGTATVAPGTRLSFRVSAVGAEYSARFEARVGRDGTFATTLNLSTVPPGTTLFVHPDDEQMEYVPVDVVAPSTPSPTPSPTSTPTPAAATPTPTPTATPASNTTSTPTPAPTTAPGVGVLGALAALLAVTARHWRPT